MLDCYNFDFMTILINIRMIIKSARNLRTHMLLVLTYWWIFYMPPSVLWHCWLGGRKGIRPVKITDWWGTGMVIWLDRGANDLHMVQLMPLPPHHLCPVKSRMVYLSGAGLPRLFWKKAVSDIHRVTDWQWRNFFISYLCQLFFCHVVGQALQNVSYSDIAFFVR